MNKIWFSSDLHLSHTKLIQYEGRPFSNAEEMDKTIIDAWNKYVGKNDIVYYLGDFCFGNRETNERYIKSLNGTIHFIRGNHDRKNNLKVIEKHCVWVKDYAEINIGDVELGDRVKPIIMCHYPFAFWNKYVYFSWHTFGHCHGHYDDPQKLSLDVGVDANYRRFGEFCPISYGAIKDLMREKNVTGI